MTITNDMIPTVDMFVDQFRLLTPTMQAALLEKLEVPGEHGSMNPAGVARPKPTPAFSFNERTGTWKSDEPVEECDDTGIDDLFGAWDFDEPPEETVRKIREARCFIRERESL